MHRIKLTMSYDGTHFSGFQRQRNAPRTIQGVFEDVFAQTFNENVVLHGSGRTDAGVHARNQVAHIDVQRAIPTDRMLYALNRLLPKDLVLLAAEKVTHDFHARKSALGKAYSYRIFNGRIPPALGFRYFCHVPQPLDAVLMRESLQAILGFHSFQGFCAHGSSVKSFDRTIYAVDLDIKDAWWTVRIIGDGFLRKMVRNLVGSAMDIAGGRKSLAIMRQALMSGQRCDAGQTAPAAGLFLDHVFYEQAEMAQAMIDYKDTYRKPDDDEKGASG